MARQDLRKKQKKKRLDPVFAFSLFLPARSILLNFQRSITLVYLRYFPLVALLSARKSSTL